MALTASDYRDMAAAARRAAGVVGLVGETVIDLGPTNLRVRFSGGPYLARAAGITASCTAGPPVAGGLLPM